MARILVIIPAYNEEAAILNTVRDLQRQFPAADYVVINDCSRDRTREILRANQLNYIDLPLNLGIGGGVQTGFQYALEHDYDIALQFDGDGQHDASFIQPLCEPILAGQADMTVGSRFVPGTDANGFRSSAARRMGISFLSFLVQLMTGCHVYDVTSGFRAFGKGMIAYFARHYAQDYPEPEAVVAALVFGYRVQEIPVRMRERQGGISSISPIKSVYYMVKVSLAIILAGLRLTGRKRRHAKRRAAV